MDELKLFTCPMVPKTNPLKVTKKGCAGMYQKANRICVFQPGDMSVFHYCKTCETGKKNLKELGGKIEELVIRKKICLLYQVAPDECISQGRDGLFYRSRKHSEGGWKNKIFCSTKCGVKYNYLKSLGKIK